MTDYRYNSTRFKQIQLNCYLKTESTRNYLLKYKSITLKRKVVARFFMRTDIQSHLEEQDK